MRDCYRFPDKHMHTYLRMRRNAARSGRSPIADTNQCRHSVIKFSSSINISMSHSDNYINDNQSINLHPQNIFKFFITTYTTTIQQNTRQGHNISNSNKFIVTGPIRSTRLVSIHKILSINADVCMSSFQS